MRRRAKHSDLGYGICKFDTYVQHVEQTVGRRIRNLPSKFAEKHSTIEKSKASIQPLRMCQRTIR